MSKATPAQSAKKKAAAKPKLVTGTARTAVAKKTAKAVKATRVVTPKPLGIFEKAVAAAKTITAPVKSKLKRLTSGKIKPKNSPATKTGTGDPDKDPKS